MTIYLDHDYFKREVQKWYDRAEAMAAARNQYNHADLPPLSDQLRHLADMVPALNKAYTDAAHNMQLGVDAARTIAGLLAEAGKAYGLTEQEAIDLSKDCDTGD